MLLLQLLQKQAQNAQTASHFSPPPVQQSPAHDSSVSLFVCLFVVIIVVVVGQVVVIIVAVAALVVACSAAISAVAI